MSIRTRRVLWATEKDVGVSERSCVICERDIEGSSREVMLINGGHDSVHQDDWDKVDESDPGHVGIHLACGSCSKRRVGMRYTRDEAIGDVECICCSKHFVSGDAPAHMDVAVCPSCFSAPGLGPIGVVP